ncbi:M4 family metallopeptidase [Pontibacter sp. G13]|uniref:M4 family metallopeptidase n=1 Tax=Pontibacter sp. G13 TaxID=3074898 RepID=UPI0028896059|nr:M4 family metallopeptidase [Pontibacter sp. G13]WNJ20773.1 M4 family metallopeptidase [Pontibacter sp. G13]
MNVHTLFSGMSKSPNASSWLIFIFCVLSIPANAQGPFSQKLKSAPSGTSAQTGVSTQLVRQPTIHHFPTHAQSISWHRPTLSEASTGYQRLFQALPPHASRSQDWISSAKQFLSIPSQTQGNTRSSQDFQTLRTFDDELGQSHALLQQTFAGVPIYGAEIWIHRQHHQILVNGWFGSFREIHSPSPRLTREAAQTVMERITGPAAHWDTTQHPLKQLLAQSTPHPELIYYASPDKPEVLHLAWQVVHFPHGIHRHIGFVDAHTGELLHSLDHTCTVGPEIGTGTDLNGVSRSVDVFETNGTYTMLNASEPMYTGPTNQLPDPGAGYILTVDMNNTTTQNPSFFYINSGNLNSWPAVAISAHYNAATAYDYFLNTFGRNSINNRGGDILSMVNVADDDGGGLDNAFWNGAAMFYGNGRTSFKPLAGALDVGGHEMSHGVIEASANLEYQNQSGALNESFADIFGAMIDRDDWQIGEDIVMPQVFPSGALRDLEDPNQGGTGLNDRGWQPKHMDEFVNTELDNGGVHINSGIPNHAYYLYASAIGRSSAEQVFYRALTVYLTRRSDFQDARNAVLQSAEDLFGSNSNEVTEAGNAFDDVGLFDDGGGGNGGSGEVPSNPGDEFLSFTNLDPADPNSIYIAPLSTGEAVPVSQTPPFNKISITDDGDFGYFVGEDHHIYQLSLNPDNPSQTQVSVSPDWDNVAISKDGLRLAAVSNLIDTSIYVFNLAASPITATQYILFNPTTAPGDNSSGGVLYADAISWDLTGEFILYDAFNQYNNPTGPNLEYWDVGFLHAWDPETDDFGDGSILKLFTNLPEGVNLGNAVFSQNAFDNIAFDFFDVNSGEISVLSANVNTGEIGTIFANNQVLGYPSFSVEDNACYFDARDNQGSDVLGVQPLSEDRLQGVGDASIVIGNARWGVGYADGSRVIQVAVDRAEISLPWNLFPNPVQEQLVIEWEQIGPGKVVAIEILDMQGRKVWESDEELAGRDRLAISTSEWNRGLYAVRIMSAGSWEAKLIQKR